MTTEERALLTVLAVMDHFQKKYANSEYLCTWYSLEITAARHPSWPGFDVGPPRAVAERAVSLGLAQKTRLPSPQRSFESDHYTLTPAGAVKLADLKAQYVKDRG